MFLIVAISIVPVLLPAYYINTFQIGNNTNPTKHHAIRKHKHGGNHGSPAESHRRILTDSSLSWLFDVLAASLLLR